MKQPKREKCKGHAVQFRWPSRGNVALSSQSRYDEGMPVVNAAADALCRGGIERAEVCLKTGLIELHTKGGGFIVAKIEQMTMPTPADGSEFPYVKRTKAKAR